MKIIGSRLLGLNNENSDYDYMELSNSGGTTYKDIVNVHFENRKHCYYVPESYMKKVSKFEIDDRDDIYFIFCAEDYKTGIIEENPFDYRDKWIAALKALNIHCYYFYNERHDIYKKRSYHIMFNLECLKQNTLNPTMERVRAVYEHKYTQEEFEKIMEERFEL